jgi:hypothetical protein
VDVVDGPVEEANAGEAEVRVLAAGVGSGSKVTCTVNEGATTGHPPLALPPEDVPLVELCNVTSLTPSIRRRRSSISATAGWLVAHPASVNVGTVPGGVAELTVELAAEADPFEALVDAAGPVVEPTVPLSEEIDVLAGSTRPNS